MSVEDLVEEAHGGVKLRGYVKPRSRETRLALEEGELVFYTEEEPVKGRAVLG